MGDGDVRDPCTAQLLADLPLRHISDAQPRPRPRPQLPSLQFGLQSQNLLGGGAVYSFEKPILFFNITTAVNRGLTVCLAHGGRGGGALIDTCRIHGEKKVCLGIPPCIPMPISITGWGSGHLQGVL